MMAGLPQEAQDSLGRRCRTRRVWAGRRSTRSWWRTSSPTPCSTVKPSGWTAPSGCNRSRPQLTGSAPAGTGCLSAVPRQQNSCRRTETMEWRARCRARWTVCPRRTSLISNSCSPPRSRPSWRNCAEFLAAEVVPYAQGWWDNAEFPAQILPKLAALGLSTPAHRGYSYLFAGLVDRRDDPGGHLAGYLLPGPPRSLCRVAAASSVRRSRRIACWTTPSNLRTTGAFALTEPQHGSDVAGGMATTATRVPGSRRRRPTSGCINGAKRWIGNGTFCDYMLLWAKDAQTGQIRGFIVDATLPGVTRTRIENKIALRTVQNAHITLRMSASRSATASAASTRSRRPTDLLRGSRIMVAWQAVGQQLAAFDVARPTPSNASSSAGRWPASSWSSSSWCRCWATRGQPGHDGAHCPAAGRGARRTSGVGAQRGEDGAGGAGEGFYHAPGCARPWRWAGPCWAGTESSRITDG